MGKYRSIQQQFFHVVESNRVHGVSKRGDRISGKGNESRVYSNGREKILKDTAKQFANYLKENHPEIKQIKEIKPEHVQEWVDSKSKQWTNRTTTEKISEIRKLEELAKKTFNINTNMTKGVKSKAEKQRDESRAKPMKREHLEQLREELKDSKAAAKIAVELSYRIGLRNRESAFLRGENIDLKNKCVHIREGAKGGKYRDIPIREKDMEFFRELKDKTPDTAFCCGGVEPSSINKGIRRSMENIGISKEYRKTSEHAIRKIYASERMKEITGTDERTDPRQNKKEFDAWRIVQAELGHTDKFRFELYNTYAK